MKALIRKMAVMAAVLWSGFALTSIGRAQFGPHLNKGVAAATTIVIGRLDQYIAEPESMDRLVEEQLRSSNVITGNPAAIVMETVQQRGTYVFTITSTLKGHPPQPLVVRLPRLTEWRGSISFEEHELHIPLKGTYLLLLSGDETTGFKATSVAPMPVGVNVKAPKESLDNAKPDAVLSAVVQLFVDSLADPTARRTAAFLLSDAESEDALKAMRPLADDPDVGVRRSALECMAANQDVTAIPKIAAWNDGQGLNGALGSYKTAAALPYLNKLIEDSKSQWTRLNAVMALRQIPPDKSSIPSLIKALRDPENATVSGDSYAALQRIVPELGRAKGTRQGIAEEDIQRAEAWWADEQAGKHK